MNLSSALLLARQESLVTIDKQMLRNNDYWPFRRFSFMDSGLTAAQNLAAAAQSHLDMPDLLVCDLPLADMTAVQFLSLIRLHAALRNLPVLLLGHDQALKDRTALEKLQPLVYLIRPYTQHEFIGALRKLAAHTAAIPTAALSPESETAFRAALKLMAQPRQEAGAEDLLRRGIALLRKGQPVEARKAFRRAIERFPAFTAQGLQGLAEVEVRHGNADYGRQLLHKAAIINIRAHNFQAAQRAFSRLEDLGGIDHTSAYAPAKGNPLYQAGAALLKSGHFEAAASAFWHGMNLTPQESMIAHIARACQFTSAPEKAAVAVCQVMDRKSPSLARDLRKTLLGEGLMEREERDPSLRDYGAVGNFIANVYNVARYTVHMYKQA